MKKLRSLHLPTPVTVRTDARGHPTVVGRNRVIQVREVWRIEDEWWRVPLSRLYFEVILENGSRTVLYRDLADDRWYRS